MEHIGPMLFIALRFLVGGLAVLPFAVSELKKAERGSYLAAVKTHKTGFFFVGLAFFIGMASQQVGLIFTTVTNAGFLTAIYVIMVPLIMLQAQRD